MTLAELKKIMRITDTSEDDYLIAMLPAVIEWVKGYCNNDFSAGLPDVVKVAIAKYIQFTLNEPGMKSESLGDYSYTRESGVPKAITDMLTPYRSIHQNSDEYKLAGVHVSNWRVTEYD